MARPKDYNRILSEAHDGYTMALDFDASNNPIYIGKAAQGTSKNDPFWQLRKLTFDTNNNPTDIQYPNADDSFIYIWNSRVSYTYS